jgi:hypothetical protein
MLHWGKAWGRGGFDIAISAKRQVAEAAVRARAKAVIERWNEQLAASQDMLWSSTIRAALIAGTPWLDVFCPGCGTSRAIDLRKVDRHLLASIATLVLGLRCSWCPESSTDAEDPRIARLTAPLPAAFGPWPSIRNRFERASANPGRRGHVSNAILQPFGLLSLTVRNCGRWILARSRGGGKRRGSWFVMASQSAQFDPRVPSSDWLTHVAYELDEAFIPVAIS